MTDDAAQKELSHESCPTGPEPAVRRDIPVLDIPGVPAAAGFETYARVALRRRVKQSAKRLLVSLYKLGLKIGVVILPNHYYCNAPDITVLAKTVEHWGKKSELPGLRVDLDAQTRVLRETCDGYRAEYAANRAYREGVARGFGPGYGYVEAQALHAFIRHRRPQRIIEVGSGVSTHCMLTALAVNAAESGKRSALICIEPHPSPFLRSSGVQLIEKPVQQVPVSLFQTLDAGDFLFIDSTHTVKTGSDVNFLILEVLPRLRQGVLIHFHDIYLPFDYGRDALDSFFDWAETSLLRAYLAHNDRVRILFCLSHLHYERRAALHECFPEYRPQRERLGLRDASYRLFGDLEEHFPTSTYLEIL